MRHAFYRTHSQDKLLQLKKDLSKEQSRQVRTDCQRCTFFMVQTECSDLSATYFYVTRQFGLSRGRTGDALLDLLLSVVSVEHSSFSQNMHF